MILLAITGGLLAGCNAGREPVKYSPPSGAALFGTEASPLALTIGRSEWPATEGRFRSVEDEVYVQYYRDFQGNAASEQNYPIRQTYAYRLGATRR